MIIAPSILAADFSKLGDEVSSVLQAGADWVHIDVMDNHYVPNLTIGPLIPSSLRKSGINAFFDVHLMIKPVDLIIPEFAKAGANLITVHPETTEHLHRTLQLIKSLGCKAGVAFNPSTPLSYLDYIMDSVDLILIMSVNPGFGGQSFIPSSYDKIREVRSLIEQSGRDISLQVDGGVKVSNIKDVRDAGADNFVMGSAIFSTTDYQKTISDVRHELSR
ncbi:ribulose-phosphate 3-epimerase [bacterium]|jgi:ribulose-phosphate 3-epimerase|nr:ribulose-phosphate 3-epimerase [bacterium]